MNLRAHDVVIASGSLSEANLKNLALKANESQATIQANIDWQNGVSANFSGALSSLKAQYLTGAE